MFLAFSRVVSCFIVLCFLFFRPRENVRIRRRCSVHHSLSLDWQCKGTKFFARAQIFSPKTAIFEGYFQS